MHTFKVLPRRWVVERTFGWIMKYRRCVRDYERQTEHHETYLYWSMITVTGRRVARHKTAITPPTVPGHLALRVAAQPERTWLTMRISSSATRSGRLHCGQ